LHFTNALINSLSSSCVRLRNQTANQPASCLITIALLVFGVGLSGCGANQYAGMSRAASGEIGLEEATGAVSSESHRAAAVREVAVSQLPSGINGRSDSAIVMGPESTQASIHPMTPLTGEAAMAVKAVSSLKMRKVLTVQSLTCGNQSMTGAGTTQCTVTLSSTAPSAGFVAALSSDKAAVSVPGSVTVVTGASKATFPATVAAVSATQTASLTANAGGSIASFGIQLNAYSPALSVSSTTVSFGAVSAGQTATSSVQLTSSGNAPLTISSILVAGSLFQATGLTTPLTLNPGQSARLTLQFHADHVSSFTGVVTISSNSPVGAATINMSGDGVAPALAGLTCNDSIVTGSKTEGCSVSLNAAAPDGGVTVALSSNNGAVSVPASVVVPAGASSASFAAAVAAVSTAQTASITGTASGSAKSFGLQLNVAAPALTVSSTSVPFGAVVVGQTATSTVSLTSSGNSPLTISSISVAGSLFKATGVTVPLTLNPGQTATLTLQFYSDHTSSFTGIVTILSNAAPGAATINMTASGGPSVSGLTCNTTSYAAAGTDSCLVSLYGTAPDTGLAVSLASNNSSVVVPASVTVAPGAMSASFSASVKAVSTGQTATVTATAGGTTKSFVLQLGPSSAVLTANASSIPFGSVLLNSPAEQSITLSASGSAPITISSVAITGAGFSESGLTAPITLNPGQTVVLNVQFTPTAAGTFSGQVTIGSSASGGTLSIGLSGTGYGHSVQLNWSAASSSAVAGYNVYRAASGGTGYQRVNSAAISSTTYSDGNVQCGTSYVYYVKSVDGSGVESVPSNTTAAAIPTP
jgi:hypothetical protein